MIVVMLKRFSRLATMVVAAFAFLVTPCRADLFPNLFGGDDGREVWTGSDQWVRIVPQDAGAVPAPLNEHPATLEPEVLTRILSTLLLWREGGLLDSGDETLALFTAPQASLLGRKLSDALAEAQPNEDVTFAVMGLASKLVVGREHFSTAGRVFVQGGKLQLIIGDMHRTYQYGKEKDISGVEQGVDRRIHPHNPGERKKARAHPARIMNTDGVAYHKDGAELRGDWIEIDIKAALAAADKRDIPESVQKETAKVRQEAAKLAIERRQMREELARLRQQMDQMQAGGAEAGTAADRLARLEALREKNLISPEEYEAKRKAILDEI